MTPPAFGSGEPPGRLLQRPKPVAQHVYDLALAPLRLMFLPDEATERLGASSLRAERMAAVLPELRGRVLDIGAGDNLLVRLYRRTRRTVSGTGAEDASVGVDVHDWGGGCTIVPSTSELPFAAGEFDTVAFVACLNHIPERERVLREAKRVLRPDGRLVATMIGPIIGAVGHRIWWYSEDKHRQPAPGERDGLSRNAMLTLLESAGFSDVRTSAFVYGLNTLYVARTPGSNGTRA